MKIAVQLYSLRDIIKGSGEELLAILPKIKALGYDGVEFAGYFGVDAETLRAALDSAGLVAVGTHIAIESYSPENFDETAAFCRTLGMKTMGMGGADHETPEELKATCAELKAADERAVVAVVLALPVQLVCALVAAALFARGAAPQDTDGRTTTCRSG